MNGRKKKRINWSKLILSILGLIVICVLIYFINIWYKKWSIERIENADVLDRVRSHIMLPKVSPNKIIRINNIEALRAQNAFYKDIEEGDFIIIYPKKAYIYDSRHDILRDVVY